MAGVKSKNAHEANHQPKQLSREGMSHHGKVHAASNSAPHINTGGFILTLFTRSLLHELAKDSGVRSLIVSSVKRTANDQARILYNKHVKGSDSANYKNPAVNEIIQLAKNEVKLGSGSHEVIEHLADRIHKVKGGEASVSNHLNRSPFIEIFDIAYYSVDKKTGKRHYYMSKEEAVRFLAACRARVPNPIMRIGHDEELPIDKKHNEFKDNRCFHIEVRIPILDKLEEKFKSAGQNLNVV